MRKIKRTRMPKPCDKGIKKTCFFFTRHKNQFPQYPKVPKVPCRSDCIDEMFSQALNSLVSKNYAIIFKYLRCKQPIGKLRPFKTSMISQKLFPRNSYNTLSC